MTSALSRILAGLPNRYAYLVAFAIAAGRKVVTTDRGFRQVRGLAVEMVA